MTSWNLDNFVLGSYWIAAGAVRQGLDGRMDGWMGGWVDGQMGGWMNEQMVK